MLAVLRPCFDQADEATSMALAVARPDPAGYGEEFCLRRLRRKTGWHLREDYDHGCGKTVEAREIFRCAGSRTLSRTDRIDNEF